jgi:hypothetical protein
MSAEKGNKGHASLFSHVTIVYGAQRAFIYLWQTPRMAIKIGRSQRQHAARRQAIHCHPSSQLPPRLPIDANGDLSTPVNAAERLSPSFVTIPPNGRQ